MRTSSTKNSLIIGISIVLGASLLSIGVSNAAGTSIKACAKKSNGAMRLIDVKKKCAKSERTLTWGPQGSAGATGATGAVCATGATGAAASTLFGTFNALGVKDAARSSAAMPNATSGGTGIYTFTFASSIANCTAIASPVGEGVGVDTAIVKYTSASVITVRLFYYYEPDDNQRANNGDFSMALFCN